MSRIYGMPMHKLITKRYIPNRVRIQPVSVFWVPKEVTHRAIRTPGSSQRWEIFAQTAITIQPRTSISQQLGFGVRIIRGVCLVSLRQAIKEKRCSLQDGTISEDVEDIVVTIQNNSDSVVIINEGNSLCYINYHV